MPSVIQIKELKHSYELKQALSGISLSVNTGEIHGLIGPDSAGKTTLMRILCGLLPIQQGEVRVLDMDVKTSYQQIRARLGYMPQRFSLYQDLSVQENLMFFARLFSVTADERDKRLSELYAFSRLEQFKSRKAGALSGGMKQKLALSCALIHRPELMILDEPTYGVDPVSRQEFWQMLKSIQADGTTIFVSTPYMDEAELCDKVTLIYNGTLLVSDEPAKIIQTWDKQVYRLMAGNPKELEQQLSKDKEIDSCQQFGNELHLVLAEDKAEQVKFRLEKRYENAGIRLEQIKAGMEDIYLDYMQNAGKADD
jgi:ABC-2 type transport system ATP-binding protein